MVGENREGAESKAQMNRENPDNGQGREHQNRESAESRGGIEFWLGPAVARAADPGPRYRREARRLSHRCASCARRRAANVGHCGGSGRGCGAVRLADG